MFIAKDKLAEQKRIVEFLAQGSDVPVAEIARLYARERIALEAGARIKTFIPVFLIRNVRARLRQIGICGPVQPSAEAAEIPGQEHARSAGAQRPAGRLAAKPGRVKRSDPKGEIQG